MGLIFNLTIVWLFILHQTSSAKLDTKDQLTREEIKFNDKISYLMEQMEKLEKKNSNLSLNLNQVDQRLNWLNETVKQVSNWTKTNSNDIDSIGQCLNISIKDCNKKDHAPHLIEPAQPLFNQNLCSISEPSQFFNLSPDTLVYTWKNLNASILDFMDNNELEIMESDIFSLDKYGMNGQLKLLIHSNGMVEPFLKFLKKQPSDTWPLKVNPRIAYVMKVENKGKVIDTFITADDTFKFGYPLQYDTYGDVVGFHYYRVKLEPKYEMGETFSIEVHVETPDMSNQFYSVNGTVKGSICPCGKVTEWTYKRQIDWIPSPYFYTSSMGYRAVVLFHLNKRFTTEGFYVQIVILSGLFDSHLKMPKWKGKITLLNQVDANRSVTQLDGSLDDSSYLHFNAPFNVSEFVVNDELKYEVSIEVLN